MECEPARINASSFADKVSPAGFKRESLQLAHESANRPVGLKAYVPVRF
jgi:hypothetical protein